MPTRTWLVVLACAVLGIAAGVGAGLALDRATVSDPLALGIAMDNLDCNGQVILAVGFGSTAPVLAAAVQEQSGNARYLDTRRSCRTSWSDTGLVPRYVVYRPYPSRTAACNDRMTPEHRGDRVLRMVEGNQQPVQCLCYVSTGSLPTLTPGAGPPSVAEGMYVNALQNVLVALGLRADAKTNGLYDANTVAAIKRFQTTLSLPATGVTTPDTWHSLLNKGCRFFTS